MVETDSQPKSASSDRNDPRPIESLGRSYKNVAQTDD